MNRLKFDELMTSARLVILPIIFSFPLLSIGLLINKTNSRLLDVTIIIIIPYYPELSYFIFLHPPLV